MSPTNIFAPVSTPAESILGLSVFVFSIVVVIFVVVFALLAYAVVRFRSQRSSTEPAQIYGSTQVELAWTVIPVLIVVALFLAATRVILAVQNAPHPASALNVIVTGHQYWWEYRYPQLNIVTANELHVPVSDPAHPTPTFLTLLSADTDHSFWVPRLGGKTDLIPNHRIRCGSIRTNGVFWAVRNIAEHSTQNAAASTCNRARSSSGGFTSNSNAHGRAPSASACLNRRRASIANISGTPATGRFGPDLTHLMSRDTIAAGGAPNTPEKLRLWIKNPDAIKPGSKMPAMGLDDHDLDAVTAYLETLR